jgi:hypothetical protein
VDIHIYHHFDSPSEARNTILKKLHHLITQQEILMTTIADFAAQMTAYNEANTASMAVLSASIDGVTGDVANLNAQIAALQASATGLSAADQAVLEDIAAKAAAVATGLATMSANAATLDAVTPPVAPV